MTNEKRMYRPKYLDQFIGQNIIRKNLKVFIESSLKRQAISSPIYQAQYSFEHS